MKRCTAILFAAFWSMECAAQVTELRIVFQPASPQFSSAAHEYEAIWTRDGTKITEAMQAVSGLKFEDRVVHAMVLEVSSSSGYKDTPMRLRASYAPDTKKATLIHELGHRLQADLFHRGEEEHQYLFL